MAYSTMCFLLVVGVAVLEIWSRRRRMTSFIDFDILVGCWYQWRFCWKIAQHTTNFVERLGCGKSHWR